MKKETNEVDNKLQNFKNDLLEFDKKLIILDSLFIFNDNSAMMIDLRE